MHEEIRLVRLAVVGAFRDAEQALGLLQPGEAVAHLSAANLPSLVTGAKEVGMMMPSACFAQPCSVSMLEELVRPTRTLGFTPWRCISFSTPQVVNGCAAMAT